jgi:hypothetical protein
MSDIVLRGYVQKRRGILTHLLEGRMTLNEYLVFDVLLLLADKETGSYMINATAVRFWTGEQLSKDAADKALRGLDEKGYIVREIVAGKKAVYPYHIQKFVVTGGAEVGKVLTFTKKAKGVEKTGELLEYFGAEPADEGTTETPTDTHTETPTEGADKTKLNTGDRRPETGVLKEGGREGRTDSSSSLRSSSSSGLTSSAVIKLELVWRGHTDYGFKPDEIKAAERLIDEHGLEEVEVVLKNALTERPKSAAIKWGKSATFVTFADNYEYNHNAWRAWQRTNKAKAKVAAGKGEHSMPQYRKDSGQREILKSDV